MDDSFKVHNNIDDTDPQFRKRLEGLANCLDGMPVQPQVEKIGQTEYQRDPKTGQLRRMPVNWKERAVKAEKFFLGMVEERKKLQELILEACVKLRAYEFECKAGKLEDCLEFQEIMAFARGVPQVHRPPLETMRLDGKRGLKKMRERAKDKMIELYLECGHIIIKPAREIRDKKINDLVSCLLCTAMLKEKQMYKEPDNGS